MDLAMKEFIKSIGAGASIAIGAMIFLALGGVAGALFFTIGLYLILWFKLNLYTGKVGYLKRNKHSGINLFFILIGNIVGCCLIFIITPNPIAMGIVATKLAAAPWAVLLKSIICGILIYAAVEQYKQGREYAPAIAVPAFILCGAEHCIADICFAMAAGIFNIEFLIFISIVIVGNAIGSLLFRFMTS